MLYVRYPIFQVSFRLFNLIVLFEIYLAGVMHAVEDWLPLHIGDFKSSLERFHFGILSSSWLVLFDIEVLEC